MSKSSVRPRGLRLLATALAVGIGLAGLAGCGSEETGATDSAGDHGRISVQYSWIKNEEFAGEYYAYEKGYYDEAGFSEVNGISGPDTGVAKLLSGTVQVALSDAASVGAAIANEEAPLKIIGATFQKNPFTILSLKDGGDIATVEDLKGKKIGVQDSNTSLVMAFLAANGLTTDDVTIVPVQYDPAPLINGEVDGFTAYLTNESIIVEHEGYEVTNLPLADNGLPFPAETIITTDEMIKNDPETVKAFLKAEIQGWSAAINDPEECARLAYEEFGADLDLNPETSTAGAIAQLEQLVVSDETVENGIFTISDDLKKATIKSLADAGIVVTAEQLFDTSLLEELYEENPDLVAYTK